MAKKYKHIKLPSQLMGASSDHAYTLRGRNIQSIPALTSVQNHKSALRAGISKVEEFQAQRALKLDDDKKSVDVKIKFRGTADREFLDRYRTKVYRKYDERPEGQEYANDVVLGSISTQRLPDQDKSDFERLRQEFNEYVATNKLKWKFDFVDEFKPLTLNEVTTPSLLEEIVDHPNEKHLIDVVFGSDKSISERKMSDIKQEFGDEFIIQVNSDKAHYCRLEVDKSDLDKILSSYAGVVSIEKSPVIVFSNSENVEVEEFDFEDKTEGSKPVLVVDTPVDRSHPLIRAGTLEQVGDSTGDASHGTQVASLVIGGQRISARRTITLENKVLPITAFKVTPLGRTTINEELIEQELSNNSNPDLVTIINLSINNYIFDPPYMRNKVDKLTVLFDEWAKDYNALFVISVGNLFKNWPQEMIDAYIAAGYPTYFNFDQSGILPPSDSINNVGVGSITYQAGADSLADTKEPSPITRRNLMKNKNQYSIKPDVVHYDSNWNVDFEPEFNGPFMAAAGGGLNRSAGTSFAAPLVTHALGIIAKQYPTYKVNTLKALLLHFTDDLGTSKKITNYDLYQSLVGHGLPDIDRALYSLNTSSSIVIEDTIRINTKKRIRIPIPESIAGSHKTRLRLRKTLVYNPPVNEHDVAQYNPIVIGAKVVRSDGKDMENATTRSAKDGAHRKSNVKMYDGFERSTVDHMGTFWEIEVVAEPCSKYMTDDILQDYSIVITVEDKEQDDSIDIHQEISQMIQVEVGNTISIDL